MNKRESISKKLRFEVFKRDSFICQYCGKHPPEVVLEIDHIRPVFDGGGSEIDNLLVACFDCNRGKGKELLSNIPMSVADKKAMEIEREDQRREYLKTFKKKKARAARTLVKLENLFKEYFPDSDFTAQFKLSVKTAFIPSLSENELETAMELAIARVQSPPEDVIKYFCGICWNLKKGDRTGPFAEVNHG